MATTTSKRRGEAVEQLQEHRSDLNANTAVASLCDGLDLLSELFYGRMDRDPDENIGIDSMLMPTSTAREIEVAKQARTLIDVYSSVVAGEEAGQRRYVDDAPWFTQWLLRLRIADFDEEAIAKRVDQYQSLAADPRRLKFSSSLERRLPLATNAPLVTYRLFPLGVQLVVAIAFGDHLRAGELRNQQIAIHPIIADCHECHGRALDNGEQCATCGNPLWGYDWLTAAD